MNKYTVVDQRTQPPSIAIHKDEERITPPIPFPVHNTSWDDTDVLTQSRENQEFLDNMLALVTDANKSYDNRLKNTIDLMVAGLDEALAYLNLEAQRHLLGLDDEADEVRQAVARALTAARGQVFVGNLRRTDDLEDVLEYTTPVAPKVETT